MATSLMTSEETDSESTVELDCPPQQKVKQRTICSDLPPNNIHKQAEYAEKPNPMNNIPLSRKTCNFLEKFKDDDKPEVNRSDIKGEIIQNQISVDGHRQCPICFERAYKTPKLLPCCHTFCLPCLKDHLRNTHSDEILVCPMCRAKIHIPEGGVKELQENYFVITVGTSNCDICREYNGERLCTDCDKTICIFCQKGHRCKKSVSGHQRRINPFSFFSDSSDSSDTDSDSSSNISDASTPWSFNRPPRPWTKMLLNECIKFSLGDKSPISIVPVSPNEAWILNVDSEDNISVALFDRQGTIKQSIPLEFLGFGLAVEESKSLLVTSTEETIVQRFTGCESTVIVPPSIFHPLGIALFPDGDIIIAGFEKSNVAESEIGCVKIFSSAGNEISNFTTGCAIIPMMVCVLGSDLIALTYPDSHCVDIRSKNGKIIGKYNGNNYDEEDADFTPVSLCVGRYCSNSVIFISDSYVDTIHVISFSGDFIGLALTSQIRGHGDLGEPGAICFDSSGKLWVGQTDDNVVSIYDIYKYSNVME